jgi:hypothetical protein
VIIELKYRDTEILKGQKLALARMNNDFEQAGKASLCINSQSFSRRLQQSNRRRQYSCNRMQIQDCH